MRVFDNGCFYTVTCSTKDVQGFADNWPCSGLANKPVTFQFDKSNGDLVDSNDQKHHPNADGGAILALCDDAQSYGASRLNLPKLGELVDSSALTLAPCCNRVP